MRHPISHIIINASPAVDDLFKLSRLVQVGKDDDLVSLQESLPCKRLKRGSLALLTIDMIDLMTHMAHPRSDLATSSRTDPIDQAIDPSIFDHSSEKPVLPLPGIREVPMSKKGALIPETLLLPVWIDFNVHTQPVFEKGREEKIVVPLKILDPNSLERQSAKLIEDGKIFRKRKGFRTGLGTQPMRRIFESEKKIEEIAQDHEMAYPFTLGIQKSQEQTDLFIFLPCKMGIRDEEPILPQGDQPPPHLPTQQ